MNKYLDISPEVKQALAEGKPVVAGEHDNIPRYAVPEKCRDRNACGKDDTR